MIKEPAKGNLDLTTLRRTAAVVGKRSYVNNLCYLDTAAVYATNCRLTTVTRTLNVCLNLAQTKIESDLAAILCCCLSCVRCVLLRTTEAHLTCR